MSIDFESLSLTEIIRLQNRLSAHIAKCYEKQLAIVFCDIIGSSAYFARFGNEAGHRIQQQHADILTEALADSHGRIVDRAGDGVFLCFPNVEAAVSAMIQSLRAVARSQQLTTEDRRWLVRAIVHWGAVLTDGAIVTGDAVNLCAKLGSSIRTQDIILTHAAMHELPRRYSTVCRSINSAAAVGDPIVDLYQIDWRDRANLPGRIVVQETGDQYIIPDKPVVSCGRMQEQGQNPTNDIVLTLPDSAQTRRISRWHIEIRQDGDQMFVCSVSDQPTVVDGANVPKGERVPVRCGSVVRLSNVITLDFKPRLSGDTPQELTLPYAKPE
jgi:class 3 adenylate cyclase